MEDKFTTNSILHQLGIGKSYSGYDYILYAIELIEQDESVLASITKVLYLDIAREFHTSDTCVERNIRKAIEIIWKHSVQNKFLILKIFGSKFCTSKPSNKEFLELLYNYIKSRDSLCNLLCTDKMICPVSKEICVAYTKIIENLINLE